MYKSKNIVNKKARTVDEVRITTFETEISSLFNSLSVEAGTNGHKGGNKIKGSRTFIKIKNSNNSDISVIRDGTGDGVAIRLSGDCELDTIIDALDFISSTLKRQRNDFENNIENNKEKNKASDSDITAKQLGYLRSLLLQHGFALKTTDIPKTEAAELIEYIKDNQNDEVLRIPKEFWKYTRRIRKEEK